MPVKHNKGIKLAALFVGMLSLQGCVTGFVLGVMGAASMVNDRRDASVQLSDEGIELKALNLINRDEALHDTTHINVVSYNGTVLLIGQAPNTMLRDRAVKYVRSVDGIKQLHNQIRIGNITKMATRTNDSWLTSKIKIAMTTDNSIQYSQVKVVTENAEVFLMGLVTQSEGNKATEITRNINGVKQVIKVFEYQDKF
ncbi:MAG: divisome-associated lipoprotein YraP [Psychrobium sp.]|nr:divisome-associated lipoprotein YraP [Psychrobium sp.]